jgi:hypothetical protein
MLPQLPYNEYLASTLAPLNVNIPLATDELSYPEDMDDLSLRFLDKPNDDVFFIKYQRMEQEKYLKLLEYKYTDKRIYFINPSNLTIFLSRISIEILHKQ